MADLISGAGDVISGINHTIGQNVIGLIIVLEIPLAIVWTILTCLIIFFVIFRRHVIVLPNQWKYSITNVIPYADGSINVYPDRGALCMEDGLRRLKIEKENVVMQKMDTIDIYPNGELPCVSLGPNKRSFGRRILDAQNKIIWFDIENPKVAIRQHIDAIKKNDPNWFIDQHATISMVGAFWVFVTMALFASFLLNIYPVFWSLALKAELG